MESYQRLEQEFGEWAGVSNVVACSSGTAALHLALETLQLPPGSQVIVPDFTMIACARAVTLAGLVPVFVDCLPQNLLIDHDLVDAALATHDKVRAIMAVHVYGRRCDMDSLHALATKYDLAVIEDLAEAHGVAPHPHTDAACWSFYRNKIIAGEEGGAVAFPLETILGNSGLADMARSLRSLGFTPAHDFLHVPRGCNYRLSNANAKIILRRLWFQGQRMTAPNLPEGLTPLEQRRLIERWYDIACPPGWRMPERDAPWVYDLRLRKGLGSRAGELQDALVRELNAVGIAARHGFRPMREQPEYRDGTDTRRSNAWRASQEVIYLPISPGTTTQATVALAFDRIARVLDSRP